MTLFTIGFIVCIIACMGASISALKQLAKRRQKKIRFSGVLLSGASFYIVGLLLEVVLRHWDIPRGDLSRTDRIFAAITQFVCGVAVVSLIALLENSGRLGAGCAKLLTCESTQPKH